MWTNSGTIWYSIQFNQSINQVSYPIEERGRLCKRIVDMLICSLLTGQGPVSILRDFDHSFMSSSHVARLVI